MTVTHAGPTTRTLYLLDDNADFRTTARWWLEGAGYRVLDFADANAAIATLEHQMQAGTLADSCLLLDVRMPAMDGHEVARHLRADPELRHVPVVLFSSVDEADVQWKAAGADVFLQKPLDICVLPDLLQQLIDGMPPEPPMIRRYG